MRARVFLKVFGTLLKLLGAFMFIPAAVSLVYGEMAGVAAFILSALIALGLGQGIEMAGREGDFTNKESFGLVAFGWLGAAAIGALPYVFLGLGPIDALFESISGFTTTGATILSEVGPEGLYIINSSAAGQSLATSLAHAAFLGGAASGGDLISPNISASGGALLNATLNATLLGGDANLTSTLTEPTYRGLLFWRSFTQWLGGMGIIVLFIAILPNLGVAGRQLFKAEVPGPAEEMIRPRIKGTAKILWGVYMVLTAAQFLLLMMAGMPAYDSICTTFSTVATGGFSPMAESIAHYDGPGFNGPLIQTIVIFFMFIAGANFALHYRTIYVNRKSLIRDPEFKFYISIVLVAIAVVLAFGGIDASFPEGEKDAEGLALASLYLRTAAFQTVSIITSTGFATADYDRWTEPAKLMLLMLMFTGACAGSTSGGIKLVRILLTMKYGRRELFKALHPKAVIAVKLKGATVKDDVLHSIMIFMAIYILIFAAATVLFASVATVGREEMVAGEMVCFVSDGESGRKVVCFGPDGWEEADRILGYHPRDGAIAVFVTPESASRRIEMDRRPLNITEGYARTEEVAGLFPGGFRDGEMISAASAVASALGNVGPGLNRFGPTNNYSDLSVPGKLILIICMWIGRLEILTVLVLLIPDFWKD
ncbi:MAG: Cation transporter [Methanothrix sp.]|nr:MAG: Cation transporter [Methanothrix sp.]